MFTLHGNCNIVQVDIKLGIVFTNNKIKQIILDTSYTCFLKLSTN